jgi:methylglutaconyl-CoA hydratase
MAESTELGNVKVTIYNEIAEIEFQHPQSNSLPGNILQKLAEKITELGGNKNVKLLLLKSAGDRVFCSGASFDELISIDNLETGKKFFSGFAKVINAARKCPKIILGRVQGKAVGGGVGMAAAVDYCMATKFAAVKLSELAVGIGPFVVGPAVERKIGKAAMSQLAINATEWKSANWAKEKGLYTEVYDSIDEMDEAIEKLTRNLLLSNPEAMSILKTVLWKGTENWDELLDKRAAISGKLVLSEFTRKAINKFKKK